MKRILPFVSVKNITFKSSYNGSKIDILRLVRLFRVTSTTVNSISKHIVKLRLCIKRVFAVRE